MHINLKTLVKNHYLRVNEAELSSIRSVIIREMQHILNPIPLSNHKRLYRHLYISNKAIYNYNTSNNSYFQWYEC